MKFQKNDRVIVNGEKATITDFMYAGDEIMFYLGRYDGTENEIILFGIGQEDTVKKLIED